MSRTESPTILRAGAHISPGQIRAFADRNREALEAALEKVVTMAAKEFPDLTRTELVDGLVSDAIDDIDNDDILPQGKEITVQAVIDIVLTQYNF